MKVKYVLLQVVVGGPRMSVKNSETESDLEVSQACPADTGSYTVIVQNREGSAQHTVSLSVVGETRFGLEFSIEFFSEFLMS